MAHGAGAERLPTGNRGAVARAAELAWEAFQSLSDTSCVGDDVGYGEGVISVSEILRAHGGDRAGMLRNLPGIVPSPTLSPDIEISDMNDCESMLSWDAWERWVRDELEATYGMEASVKVHVHVCVTL